MALCSIKREGFKLRKERRKLYLMRGHGVVLKRGAYRKNDARPPVKERKEPIKEKETKRLCKYYEA